MLTSLGEYRLWPPRGSCCCARPAPSSHLPGSGWRQGGCLEHRAGSRPNFRDKTALPSSLPPAGLGALESAAGRSTSSTDRGRGWRLTEPLDVWVTPSLLPPACFLPCKEHCSQAESTAPGPGLTPIPGHCGFQGCQLPLLLGTDSRSFFCPKDPVSQAPAWH